MPDDDTKNPSADTASEVDEGEIDAPDPAADLELAPDPRDAPSSPPLASVS